MSDDEVVLTNEESRICTWVGRKRNADAELYARNPGLGPLPCVPRHILGAHGEFAASLILNCSWRPRIGEINAPDIGDWIEVRTTDLPHGSLIVKPKDKDDRPYVLCIADMDRLRFHAVGWLYGYEAKRFPLEQRSGGDPARYVKQGPLSPLATLRPLIRPETQIAAYGEQLDLELSMGGLQ